jgi:hypothetical protein
MIFRSSTGGKKRPANVRRRKPKGLLEVSVRAQTAVRQRNRRIMRWTCSAVLTVAIGAGLWQGTRMMLSRFLWDNPDYRLSQLSVETDGILSREEIVGAARISEGENIFRLNLARARENIARIPQVESVEVQRVLPSAVNIRVTERRPVAWVTSQFSDDPAAGPAFLTDSRGVLMVPHRDASEHYRLPVIHGLATDGVQPGDTLDGEGMKAALDLLRLNAGNPRFQIRGIDLSKSYCVTAIDREQSRVTFGLEDLAGQIDKLNRLLDYCDQYHREIQTVNLMVQRNMPVVFAPLDGGVNAATPAQQENAEKSSKPPEPVAEKPAAQPKATPKPVRKATAVKKSTTKPKSTPMPVRRAIPVGVAH